MNLGRGPEFVMAQLIATFRELVRVRPPTEISLKETASLAGVNHGQVHHYFGSKDGLVAAAMVAGAERVRDELFGGGHRFPLPIRTEERPDEWRGLAYLASTDAWRQPPFEPSPLFAAMIESRAADAGEPPTSIGVLAEVAAVYALQRGWWVFRDVFEVSLEEFDLDRRTMRSELAERSSRLVDRSLPAAVDIAQIPTARNDPPSAAPHAGRGPEAVQARLLDAVRDLLADRSPTEVTAKEIAATAGVNHGQIHHYFGSKEALIASAVRREAGRFVQVGMEGGQRFPVPFDPEERPPLWRTLGHLAMTGAWPGSDPSSSPVITEMVRALSRTLGLASSDPAVHAQVAAVHSMRLGWGLFRDIAEHGLAEALSGAAANPFEAADLSAVRTRLAHVSARLVDEQALGA